MDPQYKPTRDQIRQTPDKAMEILAAMGNSLPVDLAQLCNDNPDLIDQIVEEIQNGSLDGVGDEDDDDEISESELQNLLGNTDDRNQLFTVAQLSNLINRIQNAANARLGLTSDDEKNIDYVD